MQAVEVLLVLARLRDDAHRVEVSRSITGVLVIPTLGVRSLHSVAADGTAVAPGGRRLFFQSGRVFLPVFESASNAYRGVVLGDHDDDVVHRARRC